MRQRQWIALAAFAVLVLAVGYFLDHRAQSSAPPVITPVDAMMVDTAHSNARSLTPSRSLAPAAHLSSPLPPPKAPLLSVFNELRTRVDAGDGAAATRLFHDLKICRELRFAQDVGPTLLTGALNEPTRGKSPEELNQQYESLDRTQKMMDFVHDNAAMCAGIDLDQFDATVPAMLVAARSGDLLALDCYLGMEISAVPGRLLDHPEWLTQYKQNALALAQSGLELGDWRVVKLLEFAYSAGSAGTLLGYVTGQHPDPEQAYRYQKLERLGATGDFAVQLGMMFPIAAPNASLSKEQVAAADAWAQDVYTRYFHGTSSNELEKWESSCPDVPFY